MNPPENALVLSVNEKTQIQALDRARQIRGLPKQGCPDDFVASLKWEKKSRMMIAKRRIGKRHSLTMTNSGSENRRRGDLSRQ